MHSSEMLGDPSVIILLAKMASHFSDRITFVDRGLLLSCRVGGIAIGVDACGEEGGGFFPLGE